MLRKVLLDDENTKVGPTKIAGFIAYGAEVSGSILPSPGEFQVIRTDSRTNVWKDLCELEHVILA